MKQQKNKWLLPGIIAAIVVAVVIVVIIDTKPNTPSTNNTNTIELANAVATNRVTIASYMYNPMIIKVKVGSKVTWTNKDSVHHSVTASAPSPYAPASPLLAENQSYSFTFKKAGTFSIYCEIHPYMHATVIVTN